MKDLTQSDRVRGLELFLNQYDPDGDLNFRNVKFRPRAARTTPFGIDITTPEYRKLRIHNAIDSSVSDTTGYKIYAPFEFIKITFLSDYPSFGSLFIGKTSYDFEVRIAHMSVDNLSADTKEALEGGMGLSAGTEIGECGNLGASYGRHAHTEIVSSNNGFTILDDILREKVSMFELYQNYTDDQIQDFANQAGITITEAQQLYLEEFRNRRIQIVNPWLCSRVDYLSQQSRFFYNSMALFGM